MSRTYRKIRVPQSKVGYRRWRCYFGANDVALLRNPPEPYRVPYQLSELHTETREVYYSEKDRIYVPKGTPHAEEEYKHQYDEERDWWYHRPTGRWYIYPPRTYTTVSWMKYAGRNPEYDELKDREWRDFQHVFKHVRKQGASHRHPGPCRRDKYIVTRRDRNEQKRIAARELRMCEEELSNPERDCSS